MSVLRQMAEQFEQNEYLTFQDVTPEGRKTRLVEVIAVRSGALLGVIRWYGAWRQYIFAPEPSCLFNQTCLQTITRNVQVMNAIWRQRG